MRRGKRRHHGVAVQLTYMLSKGGKERLRRSRRQIE